MKFPIVVLLCVALTITPSISYPQDAELIPSDIPKRGGEGSTTDDESGDGFFIINRRPSFSTEMDSSYDFIRRLLGGTFRSSLRPSVPSFPSIFDRQPILPDFSVYIPDVSEFPTTFPDFSELPDNYDNSTHEVKVVNGTKIEVNQTTIKTKGDNGVFVTHFHVVRYSPEKEEIPASPSDTTNTRADLPIESETHETKTTANENTPESEIEDFGIEQNNPDHQVDVKEIQQQQPQKQHPHILLGNSREKRWIPASYLESIRNFFYKKNPDSKQPLPTYGSYLGDTRVNYVGNPPEVNPDAEIFDINKLQEDKENSFAEVINIEDLKSNKLNSFRNHPIDSINSIKFNSFLNHPLDAINSEEPNSFPNHPRDAHNSIEINSLRNHPIDATNSVEYIEPLANTHSGFYKLNPLSSSVIRNTYKNNNHMSESLMNHDHDSKASREEEYNRNSIVNTRPYRTGMTRQYNLINRNIPYYKRRNIPYEYL